MSHMTKLELVINDDSCIKKAIEDLGYEVTKDVIDYYGKRQTSISGSPVVCGMKMPNGTQRFGFIKEKGGQMRLVGDSSGSGVSSATLQKQLGARYALHKSAKELRKRGFTVMSLPKGTSGKLKLTATKHV
jgi:biotin operon repressor